MRMKKSELKEKVNRTADILSEMLKGEDKNMEINVTCGMVKKNFTAKLSKQMTLDYYTEENAEVPYFHVLDVVIDKRAFTATEKNLFPEDPASLAVKIHRTYKDITEPDSHKMW